jgi:thiol-disulfide isomerase/thioredoxin
MKQFFKKNRVFLISFAVLWVGIQIWQTRSVPSGPPPQAALSLALPLINNDEIIENQSLEEAIRALRENHPNTPIALHIWAEWCSFCKLEEGSISTLASEHPVITVAIQSGDATRVQRYQQDRALNWRTLVDSQGQISALLGANGVPAFIVIDEQGHLRTPTMGYTSLWGMRLRLAWARVFA